MSLETLLEAAKYIEYRSEVKARGEEPHDYCTFSKLCSASSDSTPSFYVSSHQSSQKHSHQQHSPNYSQQPFEEIREKRRSGSSTSRDSSSKELGGSGTREVHNKLEKNRRAHLKECFEALKKQLPNMDERKTSNLSILRGALRCIQILKRKEREHEHDLEKLARDKIAFQQQLAALRKEISSQYDHIDVNALIAVEENETTTTASECGGGSDLDEDFPNETSTVSTPKHQVDKKTQPSSPRAAASTLSRSTTGFVNNNPNSGLSRSSSVTEMTPPSISAKTLSRPAAESHSLHLVSSDGVVSSSSRFVPASSLHTMASIVSPPHTVQVITPPSGIKLLAAAGASVASPATIQPFTVSPHHQQHHGQIHVLASNLPYVAAAGSKSGIPDQLVQVTDLSTQSKQQASSSPVALVSSKGFVGVTQIATATAQPVIVSQASSVSELMSSSVSSLPNSGLVKAASPVSNTTIAMTLKSSPSTSGADSNVSLSGNIAAANAPKSCQSSVNQALPESLKLAGTSRQTSSSGRQHSSISSSACSTLLPHGSNISQFSSPITVPANHLVTAGVSPFVGSVSVVSHTGGALHHQVLAQSQPIGKVLASPILKSFNNHQIPIIQQQFLQAPGTVSSQHIVKPVVVVSMPNIIHSSSISPLASRHAMSEQPEALCSPSSGSQK